MFKKLREKIVEEVRQSPIRFPGNDPFQTVSLGGDSPQKSENQGPKPEQFSITDDDGTLSDLGSPSKEQCNAYLSGQTNEKQEETPEIPSHENDHFLFQYQAPQWPTYVPQSDIESEVDDGQMSLDGVSKEQLYLAAKKLHSRVQKYKAKYSEVVKAYKDVNDEKEKIKRALTDTQDKALRRMTELREQCSLEQQAKAHLEQNLRVMLEEKDEVIGVLETKIQLLKDGGNTPDTSSDSIKEVAIVDNLVDLGTSSPDSQAADLQEMQNKVKRLEELLGRCKETLRGNKERSTLLMQERDHLASQLEQKEKEILQVQERELEVQARLRGELSEVREQMKHLEKQQEESVMAMAETKQNMHQELESREQQLAKVKDELQVLHNEMDTLKETVDQKEMEVKSVKEEKERVMKELEIKLQETERTLEEEKQSLMQEFARGKTAAIALVQEESAKKLEQQEQEWRSRLSETESKMASDHETKVAQVRSEYYPQIEEAEKAVREMKEKEKKVKSEMTKTKTQLQQHQAEVTIMKQKQEESMQRSEQEKHAINQIELKLQTLLGEKDKEMSHLSSAKETLQQQLTEYHQKTESLTNDNRQLKKQLSDLSEELQRAEEKVVEHESQLSKEQQKALMTAIRESETLLQEKNTLLEEIQKLQNACQSYVDIKTQSEENNKKLERQKDTVKKLELEIVALKENEEELRKTEARLQDLEQSCEEKKLKIISVEQELAAERLTVKELKTDAISSKESQKHVRESCTNFLQKTSAFREELASVRDICGDFQIKMTREMRELCQTITNRQQETNTLVERVKVLQCENGNLENEVKREREEKELLHLKIADMARQNDEKEMEQNEKRKLLKFLEENSEHYNGYLKHFDKQIADVLSYRHHQLENLQSVLLQIKRNINSSHKQREAMIEELKNIINGKDTEIKELKMQMAAMEVESNEVSNLLEENARCQKETKEKLEDQVNDLINKSQRWKQKAQQTLEQVKMERATFQNQMEEMEEQQLKKITLLKEEIESQKKVSGALEEQLKVAEEQIANLESTSCSWEEKLNTLQQENTKLENELSECKEYLKISQHELQSKILSLENQCTESEANVQKCKDEYEQRLNSALEEKVQEQKLLEERYHLKLAEANSHQSDATKKLSDMEELLKERDSTLKELQNLKTGHQQLSSEVKILEDKLAEKEADISHYTATIESKEALVKNLSDQLQELQDATGDADILRERCNSLQKECEDKETQILGLEETLQCTEKNRDAVIQELETKLANSVSEFESTQIKIQHLEEIIANNATMQHAVEENDNSDHIESELIRIREELEDTQIKKEELEILQKSHRSFLEEQMRLMQDSHEKTVADLKMKLELVSAQLDESLLVAEGNQSSSVQEMVEIKTQLEKLHQELNVKNTRLKELETLNNESEMREINTTLALNGNLPPNQSLPQPRDSEITDEIRTKNQEKEEQLLWEKNKVRVTLEKELSEKANALDDMRDYFQQQLQEKQEEINRLKESEQKKSKTETSDWDSGWEVEPVEDELYALDKENQKPTTEEIQDSISKYQKEVAELRLLLSLKDGKPSTPEANNIAENHPDSFLQPTEYEYLRNIMLEYMMGKEPLILAKVISAVLRFTDDQTQQILMREEAKQTSVN